MANKNFDTLTVSVLLHRRQSTLKEHKKRPGGVAIRTISKSDNIGLFSKI